MKGKRVLVVDDDPRILNLVSLNFEVRGYEVLTFSSGSLALRELDGCPEIVILDIWLPDVDGIELLRRIRCTSQVPIMMLSGREEVVVKMEALNLGADGYLTKPFSVDELLARVQAILRRSAGVPSQVQTGKYNYDELEVDLDTAEISRSGKKVKLSAQEWAVLGIFLKNVGKVVTHRVLLQQAWGPEYGNEGDYIRSYVTRLRKKLEPDPEKPRYILTEWGIGYRFINPDKPLTPVGSPA